MTDSKYIVGIDLGTSNSILAYTPAELDDPAAAEIKLLEIPQIIGPGSVTSRSMLPSFIFLPGDKDMSPDALNLPWQTDVKQVVGEFARERGAELPQRLISSAKSWLCHSMVDRNQAILPWGASPEVPKLSTVEASAAILDHIRRAWNFSMAREDESLALELQDIYLTVPASFDAVARELTVKAAEMAHLPDITLLEEPQAAFYAWIEASRDRWRDDIAAGDLVLVCDLGGGTTDFTLIILRETEGSPRFERIAVGDHLILGGDNIDLALARRVESGLTGPRRSMSTNRWKALCHQCRQAKESILGGSAETFKVTLMGEGSRLIAGTLPVSAVPYRSARVVIRPCRPGHPAC